MTTVVRVVGALGFTLALTSRAAGAADGLAQLTYLEGAATVHRAYVSSPANVGAVLAHSDEVRTTTGRAEITFKDGSVLHLDRATRVIVHERERFSVIEGRVFFRSTALSPMGYEAQTDIGRLRVWPRGVFGILVDQKNRQVLVSVAVGEAQVESPWGRTRVTSRQMALVSGATGRPYVTPFFPWRGDGFETWSSSRVLEATLSPSSPWRPSALETVGPVIDHYRESSSYTPGWVAPRWTRYPHGMAWQPGWDPNGRTAVRPYDFNHNYDQRPAPPAAPPTSPPAGPPPSPPPSAPPPPVVIDAVSVGRPSQPPPRS